MKARKRKVGLENDNKKKEKGKKIENFKLGKNFHLTYSFIKIVFFT